METFRVRLNCVDHYQSIPTQWDPPVPIHTLRLSNEKRPRVPVLRVFGATETGQKVCVHIHGAFPYLYVPYKGGSKAEEVGTYISEFRLAIDHALAISYRRNLYGEEAAFVAHISIVKGVPFYGFHVGYDYFLKIYMLDPIYTTRLADLLRQGAILSTVLQPYESHIQYVLQWMCDYNLFGCAFVQFDQVTFRLPVPSYADLGNVAHKWHDHSISSTRISDDGAYPRQSHCPVEVDARVCDIINRQDVRERSIHLDFAEPSAQSPMKERLVPSMAGLWRDETLRRKTKMGIVDPESSPFPLEVLVSVSADLREAQKSHWIHEDELRAKITTLIYQEEADTSLVEQLAPETKLLGDLGHMRIRTALQSTTDLFPAEMERYLNSEHIFGIDQVKAYGTAESHARQSTTKNDSSDLYHHRRSRSFSSRDRSNGSRAQILRSRFPGLQTPASDIGNHRDNSADSTMRRKGTSDPVRDLEDPECDNAHSLATHNASAGNKTAIAMFQIPEKYASKRFLDLANRNHFIVNKLSPGPQSNEESIHAAEIDLNRLAPQPDFPYPHSSSGSSKANGDDSTTLQPTVQSRGLSSSDGSPSARPSPNVQFQARNYTGLTRPSLAIERDAKSSVIAPSTISGISHSCRHDFPFKDLPVGLGGFFPTLHSKFKSSRTQWLLRLNASAPTSNDLRLSDSASSTASITYQCPFYSSSSDLPSHTKDYAGKGLKIPANSICSLPKFSFDGSASAQNPSPLARMAVRSRVSSSGMHSNNFRHRHFYRPPPPCSEIQDWMRDIQSAFPSCTTLERMGMQRKISHSQDSDRKHNHGLLSNRSYRQIPTSVRHETQYMSIMGLEIHVRTRGNLLPNPELDEICCLFWCFQSEDENLEVNGMNEGTHVGILMVSDKTEIGQQIAHHTAVVIDQEASELELINHMVDIVRHHDPDVLTGYEVHGGSWGYLIERAKVKYDFDLCHELSRMKTQSHGRFGKDQDRWGFNQTSTIRVTGRHTINIWRAMRGELNLLRYTMENVVYHICHQRIPHYSFADLNSWYISNRPQDLARVIDYYVARVQLDLEILGRSELIPRTSEQARLLGVDFFSVFSRGSQFKVESLMFRIGKPENFLLPSPSRKQVGQQNALECLPLVMEPQSALYDSPLLVLDFQSLYPSIMIAYNYCYSTCLGRVTDWRGHNKLGFSDFERKQGFLRRYSGQLNIAPNGLIYVKPEIRKSLLSKMLGEILETRIMVKSGMKEDQKDIILQRLLNNRQLALKLIANVTYGYTSASFSGRMPCAEIADSIVQTGRETLEKAIALIHSMKRWSAEVVYGDTDSLFVYLKGRSRAEAFDIAQEIATEVTKANPRPMKLKFEKVYQPCVLLAKKRYVGFKYESRHQKAPDFDAKGIETVRRDGTPAEQRLEETCLRILFETADLSQVKQQFQKECKRIMRGQISILDFCFAKEVKLGTYSEKGLPPPGALISTKRMLEDPRAEPQYGERVPYVVIAGPPGARLLDRCVAPEVLLNDEELELDAEYYINKNLVPPLERIFNLVGANVRQWYEEMPKFYRAKRPENSANYARARDYGPHNTLTSYMKTSSCRICAQKLEDTVLICERCATARDSSQYAIAERLAQVEGRAETLEQICRSCTGTAWNQEISCDSLDCPVYYSRYRQNSFVIASRKLNRDLSSLLGPSSLSMVLW